ncbi:type I DNA topoisomerase, partial [Myxococcota bacterium]|nr:type I DNA topoisomerase [Myxococcota bacterium]
MAASTDEIKTKKVTKKKVAKKATAKKKVAKKVTKKTAKKATSKKKVTKKAASKASKVKALAKAALDKGGTLVIVESPAKAKTIKKYLGSGYTVKASVGHIKDLPKSKLSVDLENKFTPHYEVIRGKGKVIKEIKAAAKGVQKILLAPDPDREGEAIAWHLLDELGEKHSEHTYRISFNEITKKAVKAAIESPRKLDRNLFNSQQARRILDRLVGYQISPILWDKVRRGLSAGRVQSVAVRLIVEREAEIKAFNTEEYWSVDVNLLGDNPPGFTAKVIKKGEEKFRPTNKADADQAVSELEKADYKVDKVTRRERRRRPAPPLITSKLQQEAAGRLRFTAKRTMMIAQQLYEGVELGAEGSVALITYMRTDSTRVSNDALESVREHIGEKYGADYLPKEPNVYKSKKSAQDAHEAVRPTDLAYTPERIAPFVTPEQLKLYQLIWRYFVASQMMPAVFDQTTVDVSAAAYLLRATGSIMKFPGFTAVHEVGLGTLETKKAEDDDPGAKAGDGQLPEIADGEALELKKLLPEQHFTQPPPRFSESTLVKELEDKGIGRPSTYAAILSTIVTRTYVKKVEGRFYPTELGSLVTELLVASFPKVLDVEFTAEMEEQLDQVEEGKVDWVVLLDEFYNGYLKDQLEVAKVEMRDVKREETPTDIKCDRCEEIMMIKWGRNGSFLACSGYPKCRNTKDYERNLEGEIVVIPEEETDEKCPKCEGPMVVKRGRYGKFLACTQYPECKGTRPVSIGVMCPEPTCSGYITERTSKMGRIFYGCSAYPDCTFASWDRPVPG